MRRRIPEYMLPVTVVKDRYSGVYSGGAWLALAGEWTEEELDAGPHESDVECAIFFEEHKHEVGIGPNPSLALVDLIMKRPDYFGEDAKWWV